MLNNTKILLKWGILDPSKSQVFDDWIAAVQFLSTCQHSIVDVWYAGGDGWHFYKTLLRIAPNEQLPPPGFKWQE